MIEFLWNVYLIAMATLVFYLAIMNLKRNKSRINKTNGFFFGQIIIVGLFLDFVMNVIVGTLFFRELPREWLFTYRLNRHLEESSGWRLRMAAWWCKNLLDPFDPAGSHCGR